MKTFFQKLLLSIPLRTGTAMIFAIIFGLVGLLIPWAFLFVTIQDPTGKTIYLTIPWDKLLSSLGVYCPVQVLAFPPDWLYADFWIRMIRRFPTYLWISYCFVYGPTKARKVLAVLLVFALPLLVVLSSLFFTPNEVTCDMDWQATIYGYSISWYSIVGSVTSIILSSYAFQKRYFLEKDKIPS